MTDFLNPERLTGCVVVTEVWANNVFGDAWLRIFYTVTGDGTVYINEAPGYGTCAYR